jgi:Helicase conserved C-terminal domain
VPLSDDVRDEFIKSGVRAEHVDGWTPKSERDQILARLASGQTEVVTNCQVLTEGFDLPAISCIVLARPTKLRLGLSATSQNISNRYVRWLMAVPTVYENLVGERTDFLAIKRQRTDDLEHF